MRFVAGTSVATAAQQNPPDAARQNHRDGALVPAANQAGRGRPQYRPARRKGEAGDQGENGADRGRVFHQRCAHQRHPQRPNGRRRKPQRRERTLRAPGRIRRAGRCRGG